ncbi:MAG: DUF1080 domain-containing protein [Fibrobacteria bacterium]
MTPSSVRISGFPLGTRSLALACVLGGTAWAATPVLNFPKPDSAGWIRLFRGTNTSDFYSYMGNNRQVPSQNKAAFPNGTFTVVSGDTIQSSGSPLGLLILKQPFSHYRVQFQMMWPGSIGNTGLLNKVQEDDTAQSQGFPRSIECQGDPNQGIGQIWALGSIRENGNMVNGGTWVTFHGKSIQHPQNASGTARQFDPASPVIDYGGGGDPTNNLIVGKPGWAKPKPEGLASQTWVTVEVESHGKDTTRHFVNGELVMEYTNPRIAPRDNAGQVMKYLTEGRLGWQSEGSKVWFRNMKIMLFPEDPIFAALYPTTANRDFRILAKPTDKPRFGLEGNVLSLLTGEGRKLTITGRRFHLNSVSSGGLPVRSHSRAHALH